MWNPESGKICIELLTLEGTKVSRALAVFVPIDAELNETGQTPEEAVARLMAGAPSCSAATIMTN